MRPKVSVIVPVYNVETLIGKCARSLMRQTIPELEFIFVDDCSSDFSLAALQQVIEAYPQRQPQVKILRHQRNMGVAAARASGMKVMTGEYMAHCDSDDWMDAEGYERMYAAAVAADADVVSCRYVCEPSGSRTKGAVYSGDGLGALKSSGYTYGLWDKLIRASIIHEHSILPYPGINYNEDLGVIVRVLCHSRKVLGLSDAFYHHLESRQGSICTSGYRRNVLDHSVPCIALLDKYLDDLGRANGNREYSARLTDSMKFWMKSGFYSEKDFKAWRRLWPESRRHILHLKNVTAIEKCLMLLHAYDTFGIFD